MSEKKYVDYENNKVPEWARKNIKEGDTVLVIDGSYMTSSDPFFTIIGNDFIQDDKYESLTVKTVNQPFPTDYSDMDHLTWQNNCEIVGFDGQTYYCSRINIIKYEE